MGSLTRKDWCEKERKLWANFAADSYIVQNYDKRGKNKCRNFGRCIYDCQYCCKHTCLLSGRIFRHCHRRPVSVAGESGLSGRETTTSASDGWVSPSEFRLLTRYTHTEQVPPNLTLPSLSRLTVIGWHRNCYVTAMLYYIACLLLEPEWYHSWLSVHYHHESVRSFLTELALSRVSVSQWF